MEYLKGCDLRQLVQREGPLHPARALYFLHQAASSLAEAHAQTWCTATSSPRTCSWRRWAGAMTSSRCSTSAWSRARPGADITEGTPHGHAALHGAGGADGQIDARADVYALGVVAYYMLAGQPPFFSDDPYADIHRQMYDPPPPIRRTTATQSWRSRRRPCRRCCAASSATPRCAMAAPASSCTPSSRCPSTGAGTGGGERQLTDARGARRHRAEHAQRRRARPDPDGRPRPPLITPEASVDARRSGRELAG